MTTTLVRAACPHDCPDTCALLVTVEDGVATEVKGDPDHPTTAGVLCTKVSRYVERTYHPDRLLYPMRRVGKKEEGKFERISWEQALDEIAVRLAPIAARVPQGIVPYSYCGTMGLVQGESMSSRFFNKLGASQLERTICATAGATGYKYTIGGSIGTDIEHFQDAKLILIWGGNPIASNLHFWMRAQEAKRRGAKLIAIDPYRSLTAEKCHQHIAVLPGTDSALALGMMHLLVKENLVDHDYIERHTLGFGQLKDRVARVRPEDRGRDRVQLESAGDRARFGQGGAGLCARRPVHRGAGTLPDRQRRLRGHPAAGHDPARTRRRPSRLRPPVHDGE